MANTNRASLLGKLHKVLRKHFKPIYPPERGALEQLLFACCLEDGAVRRGRASVCRGVDGLLRLERGACEHGQGIGRSDAQPARPHGRGNPAEAIVANAFEATYAFDLEGMKKQNLGQAVQRLKKFNGTSSFTGGTLRKRRSAAMPFRSTAVLDVLYIVGAATEAEVKSAEVTGLERAIPKNKGAEFASLLHQLGAELVAGPYSPNVHKILLEVSAEAKDRLPKRGQKKPVKCATAEARQDRTADRQKGAAGRREEEGRSQKETGQGCRFFAQGQKRRKKKHEPVKLAKRKPR